MKENKNNIQSEDLNSDQDADINGPDEINRIFPKCLHITHQKVSLENDCYILNTAATRESSPTIATSLSTNTCEVFSLSDSHLSRTAALSEHTDLISEIKFYEQGSKSNLLCTCSHDATIKLWDLRISTEKSALQFVDNTGTNKKIFTCFDISPNGKLISAGTNLFEGDSFVLFWDVRKSDLLGAYWESHTDDITQVKFHRADSNKLYSGSVDGLINIYDLSQECEEDALIDSLNTESSIEKLHVQEQGDLIGCVTHTADVQYWREEDPNPFFHIRRNDIAQGIKRKCEEFVYVVDLHDPNIIICGSNYSDGECLRALSVVKKSVEPLAGFPTNQQRVRATCYNPHTGLLLTGGEKGILDIWKMSSP